MVYCPFCRSENLPQSRYCQACGRLIVTHLSRARTLAEARQRPARVRAKPEPVRVERQPRPEVRPPARDEDDTAGAYHDDALAKHDGLKPNRHHSVASTQDE